MAARNKKTGVTIRKADRLGFCFGVRRAIKMLEDALAENKNISTLNPIVHNQQVVDRLSRQGINVIKNIDEAAGNTIAVSSHGLSPDVLQEIKAKKISFIDTTCVNVRSAQKAASDLAEAGFYVVIFGEAAHPEVRGLLGWAGKKAVATLDVKELDKSLLKGKVGILSQTTQSQLQFQDFVNKVISRFLNSIVELRIINTLCLETKKRQDAALSLARKSDLVIVVGGSSSANTRHLAEICSPVVETHHIETAGQIKQSWLKGKKKIGVTAGASTPDEAIEEVIQRLNNLTRT